MADSKTKDTNKKTAYEIQWDISIAETIEAMNSWSLKETAEFFGVPLETVQRMDSEQLYDYVEDQFHHRPGLLDDFYGLPYEIEIPEGITKDEDIADWLSDEYGFCHEGFKLK